MLRLINFVLTHPLSRGKPLSALSRVFRWQIATRLLNCETIVPFTAKTQIAMKRGMTGATGNFYCGLHEFEDMCFILHLLRPSDLFIDVGANIGSYTLLSSGHVGARTLSFEPIPSTFDDLSRNIRLNNLGELVELRNAAVGENCGRAFMTLNEDTANHISSKAGAGTCEVDVVCLDDLDISNAISIKIDVEGFETEVLRGASQTLCRLNLKAVLLELNKSGAQFGYSDENIHLMMLDFGFKPYSYEPFQRKLSLLDSWSKSGGNTLYLRDLQFIESRIADAPIIDLGWTSISPP